jgi:RNA polymerase sigma factor (sigma-70 family)
MYAHPDVHNELIRQRQLEANRRRMRPSSHPAQPGAVTGSLVRGAKDGDRESWATLVEQFTPMLCNILRAYRLSAADVDDAVQETWIAAYTHVGRLREPDAFAGWLAVIARRNALHIVERNRREIATVPEQLDSAPMDATPEKIALESEKRRAVRRAVERLPGRQGEIMGSLLGQPGVSYADLAERLGIPVGSIGPTRERALARLSRDPLLAGVL